jgi:nucleotide-binding universal stress UspA family protein
MSTRDDRQAVVVGVDDSAASLNAARWAGYLAKNLRAPLVVTHALSILGYRYGQDAQSDPLFVPALRDPGRWVIDRAMELVRTSVDDLVMRGEICYGAAGSVLVELGERARVLVIGQQRVYGTKLIGATTMHVVTRAHCPVVVWRGAVGQPIPRHAPVVAGVDGTALSEPAIETAFELAAAFGVPLTAIHAFAPGIESIGRRTDAAAAAATVLSESVAGWREKYPQVEVTQTVVPGDAVTALVGAAAGAQLLVVGSRARGSAAAALLGSTSRDVLHRAACPVLVRATGRRGPG